MQITLLNDILSKVVGRQAGDIVNLLAGKKNVNEFIIAKKLKLTINQVRNILYKLSDAGLISFTRKKDKKKGWYTYFWTLNTEKSLELLEGNVKKELENFKNQHKSRENKRFFFCNICKTEVNEETALLHNFTCSECGEVYALQTDRKIITELESKIRKLEGIIGSIREEIGKARDKSSKARAKQEKRDLKSKTVKKCRIKKTGKKKKIGVKGKGGAQKKPTNKIKKSSGKKSKKKARKRR